MIEGVDVGFPQGNLTIAHWRTMRAQGKRFARARCVEGLGSIDVTFASNVAGARAAGLNVGAYFPLHPDLDPVQQALDHFNACGGLGSRPGELAPAVDVELLCKQAPDRVLEATIAWCRAAAQRWGRLPDVYTFPYFDAAVLGWGAIDGATLAPTGLWMAAYKRADPPPPHAPWTRVLWWQRGGGDTYHAPNGTPCDDDVFLGTEDEYALACNQGAAS